MHERSVNASVTFDAEVVTKDIIKPHHSNDTAYC